MKILNALGRDLSSTRLARTWNHIQSMGVMYMPDKVDTVELSSGLTMVQRETVICSIQDEGKEISFICPEGMLTDGMTIPFWARPIAKPKGKGFRAAKLHDPLVDPAYKNSGIILIKTKGKGERVAMPAAYSWNYKAELFYYALRYCGFGHYRAFIMFLAVVWHGRKQI